MTKKSLLEKCSVLYRTIRDVPRVEGGPPLNTCAPEDSIRHAVVQMRQRNQGSILVVQDGQVIGIFTERDYILKVAGNRVGLDETSVAKVMTPNPVCFRNDDSLAKVLVKMRMGNFRHPIIADENGKLEGILSMRDIMNYLLDELTSLEDQLASADSESKQA